MKYFSFAFLALLFFASCTETKVNGNGNITTQTYDIKNFTGVDIGGVSAIYLTQDSTYSVKVEVDENILPYLDVKASEGTLYVNNKDHANIDPTGKMKIYISLPELEKLDISGASSIETKNKFTQKANLNIDISGASSGSIAIHSPKVNIDISGASTLDIAGETRDVIADVSGASTLNAFNLLAENTKIDASGASTARVFASVSLSGEASGASGIRYKGKPQINIGDGGVGSIKPEE